MIMRKNFFPLLGESHPKLDIYLSKKIPALRALVSTFLLKHRAP